MVDSTSLSAWMDHLFPLDKRLEMDLTEADVRLVISAEERGEDTTNVHSDISSATQIFLADKTGQADYKAVLEQLLADGRVETVALPALPQTPLSNSDSGAPESKAKHLGQTLVSAVVLILVLIWWLTL